MIYEVADTLSLIYCVFLTSWKKQLQIESVVSGTFDAGGSSWKHPNCVGVCSMLDTCHCPVVSCAASCQSRPGVKGENVFSTEESLQSRCFCLLIWKQPPSLGGSDATAAPRQTQSFFMVFYTGKADTSCFWFIQRKLIGYGRWRATIKSFSRTVARWMRKPSDLVSSRLQGIALVSGDDYAKCLSYN